MSTHWTANDIAIATHGKTTGRWTATSVAIDTRKIEPGALFVALAGTKVDGHNFVAQALAEGAVGALVSERIEGVDEAKLVLVSDVETALQDLGIAARERSRAKFVGITGSVGKTGAKEMLAAALLPLGKVSATTGNLNNHLGVPLTLANLPLDTEFAIIEMGMNHAGEISPLSHWSRPHVSLITTVEAVHIEFFPSVSAIADEKATIMDGMGGAGVAILNADNAHFPRLKKYAETRGLDRILSFGAGTNANCQLVDWRIRDDHMWIEAIIAGTTLSYTLGCIGKHWALASVATLGIVDALGEDVAQAAAALAAFHEPKGRGRIQKLAYQSGHLRLIDDCYNASPVSVHGAIEKVAAIRDAGAPRARTVVVLGDMLELGEHAEEMHVGLAPALINNQMDLVFAAGSFMKKLYDALPESMRGAYQTSSAALAPLVVEQLRPADLVLVKGSRGSRMDAVVKAIEENADAL